MLGYGEHMKSKEIRNLDLYQSTVCIQYPTTTEKSRPNHTFYKT
jgi:hypothetical protein